MATKLDPAVTDDSAPHLKRALGVWDLTWLSIVAVANLNVVPVIAAGGPTTMWLWLAALLLFFLPQGIGVIELSHRFPQEGGVYVWTKEIFGDFHGFLCGWCYWTANMFFIPSLLFYLIGIVTYVGGEHVGRLGNSSFVFGALAIALIWLTALPNILGIGIGKWVNNVGGVGTLIAAVLLIVLGILAVSRFGIGLPPASFRLETVNWNVLSSFGLICFALVGLELGCVMGDEIRDPKRTVPRGVLYGGILSGIQYVGASLALILAVPQKEMKVLQGVMQAVDKMAGRLGAGWTLWPIAALVAISTVGAVAAWLSGSARILFVSGIDQYLPRIFGKIHPRYDTPHIALIGISALCSCLIAMSFAGESSIREAYVTLLQMAVVLQMIAYSYVYASLAQVAFGPLAGKGRYKPWKIRFAAVSGFAATALGAVVAFVPSEQVDSIWRFELKMFLSCVVFLAAAAALFWYYSRRKVEASVISSGAEI
jgi:glutamate:GABA antiporter